MDAPEQSDRAGVPPPADPHAPVTPAERGLALLEVLICSDYPTQLALAGTLAAFGYAPGLDGSLSLSYVAAISLADSALLIGLIVFFTRVRGESVRDLLLGRAPLGGELRAGVPLLFVAFAIAVVLLVAVQTLAPWLHTVPDNPLKNLVHSPLDAVLFALVLIVAGGVREEVQRAFLLNRFERWLGGPTLGLVVSSVVFGAGHFLQGADAAIATAALGAFWGATYLRRRSIASTVVSHAGFNLVQILQFLIVSR